MTSDLIARENDAWLVQMLTYCWRIGRCAALTFGGFSTHCTLGLVQWERTILGNRIEGRIPKACQHTFLLVSHISIL